MAKNEMKPRVIDSPAINEIYSDELVSTSFGGGAMVITLGTTRFVPERIDAAPIVGQHPAVYVNNRIALSPALSVKLVNAMARMMDAANAHATKQHEQTIAQAEAAAAGKIN